MSTEPPSPSRHLTSSSKTSGSNSSSPNKPYMSSYNPSIPPLQDSIASSLPPFSRTPADSFHIPTPNVLPPLTTNANGFNNVTNNNSNADNNSSRQNASNQGYRPLNVKDALSYLDQVKVRFSDQPEVYNRFLDIMKEFKSQAIDTPGVIERVSTLFRGHPTLISGFNTFLPPGYRIECSVDDHARDVIKVTTPTGTTTSTSNDSPYYYQREPTYSYSHQQQTIDEAARRPPIEFNHAINYVNKIKNRFANDPDVYKRFLEILQTYQKEQKPITEVYSQVQILFNGATDLLNEFKQFLPDTTAAAAGGSSSSKKQSKRRALVHSPKQKKSKISHHHSRDQHTSDVRSTTSYYYEPVLSAEEAEFFEKVRKHIGNKTTYYSFLKVLNLFCQQILDQNGLIERCESFLGGNKELFNQLKVLVGYCGQDKVIENIPAVSHKAELLSSPDCGPSYRMVPESWQAQQRCSGRDALCKEVLNDQYVSHPTWASEDGGFIASKKNIFEEALHRVEEERYDYDINIEANLNTISLLEPLAKRISAMPEEEKNNFKLPVGLGGPSKTIYQRIIKKIYGKEQGTEVIEMLHRHPAQAVPVVLKRLKQKDEEWRKAQREWNKVWREIEVKNYYKALDYQGVNFKTNDRKAMSVKSLVTEIEVIRLDQEQEYSVRPQFVFDFKDKLLFKDVARVLFSYFERQSIYGSADCEVMKAFVEMFLPVFFDVPDVTSDKDEKRHEEVKEELIEDEDIEDDMTEDEEDEMRRSYTRHKENSPETTNTPEPSAMDISHTISDTVTENAPEKEDEPTARHSVYTFFGNTTFYCFFRLFQMAYDRLGKMKRLDQEYQLNKSKHLSKAAIGLGADNKIFQSLNLDVKQGYYKTLLKLIDKFFDDELDQQTFEECSRYIFGTRAYILFSIDKLMQSIVRQLHHIVSDPKAQTLLSYFKEHHEYEKHTAELTKAYRMQVTEILGNEDEVYNLSFNTVDRTMSIQLLDKNDDIFELHDEDGYNEYVSNYIDWEHDTPNVNRKLLNPSYLKRNIRHQSYSHRMRSNMQYKICRNTYHLFYVIGTEDSLVAKKNMTRCNEAEIKSNRFKSWLEKKQVESAEA
ncbi:Putative Component of the Sin3p-Rpd3p histone deacetylase complex [Rhizopus microsporus]|nr:Putative Component of the Sin3p-Rpd3p histone deacetylase complex [Rhizopus microsporus]